MEVTAGGHQRATLLSLCRRNTLTRLALTLPPMGQLACAFALAPLEIASSVPAPESAQGSAEAMPFRSYFQPLMQLRVMDPEAACCLGPRVICDQRGCAATRGNAPQRPHQPGASLHPTAARHNRVRTNGP